MTLCKCRRFKQGDTDECANCRHLISRHGFGRGTKCDVETFQIDMLSKDFRRIADEVMKPETHTLRFMQDYMEVKITRL